MRLLEFNQSVSLTSVIDAVKAVPEKEITLKLSPDTPWLTNPVNKKILRKAVHGFGKTLHFEGEEEPVISKQDTAAIPSPVASQETQVISNEVAKPDTPEQAAAYQEENEDPDDTGFMVGQDVAQSAPPAATSFSPQLQPHAEPEIAPRSTTPRYIPKSRFAAFGYFLMNHKILTVVGAVVVILLLLGYIVFFLPKADVKIIVEDRPLETTASLTVSSKVTSADTKNHIIPAITKTSSQSGTLQAQTSGSKKTGTKATGTVTIANATGFAKTFPAGQVITASGLKFNINQSVTVPKATSIFSPGKADAAVTAADFGSNYNLAAGTIFTIDGSSSSDYQAQNSAALSGGESHTIQVVAQADLDKLTSDLTKTLTDKAHSDVLKQVGNDYTVTNDAIKTTATNKSFDHQAGDQADNVTLSLTITATATVYKSQDLKDMLVSILKDNAPEGFEVDKSSADTSTDLTSVADNGDLTFSGHIKADLTPQLDTNKLASNLAGKSPSAADPLIKAIPQIVSYNVSFWPNLPAPLKTFPRDPKRIHISVSANKQ